MGEIADHYIDRLMDNWGPYTHTKYRPTTHFNHDPNNYGKWMQANGDVIAISDMSDYHLTNTLNFLRRRGDDHPKIEELIDELAHRAL